MLRTKTFEIKHHLTVIELCRSSAEALVTSSSTQGKEMARRKELAALTGLRVDVVRNPGMVSFVIDIGDPAVLQIGSIIWIVRDSQSTREELVGIRHIAERQCDGSFKRRR